jgi:hypothetical protein
MPQCKFWRWRLPQSSQVVYTREKREDVSAGVKGIFSHKLYDGIDNTGNIRVWDAENVMLYILLTSYAEDFCERFTSHFLI